METKKAVLIGNNNYPHTTELKGCVNDAERIGDMLKTNGKGDPNFSVWKFHNLINAAIKNEISELLNDKRAPDSALLYFAGHGYIDDSGGYICGVDSAKDEMGVPMSWLANQINGSRIKEIIIILDCCHAGEMLNDPSSDFELAIIRKGVTILAATTRADVASEFCGRGFFSDIIYDGLCGAAIDILGHVTAMRLYQNAELLLTPWQQRPVFKSYLSELKPLRKCLPPVRKKMLRIITKSPFFTDSEQQLQLSQDLLTGKTMVDEVEYSNLDLLLGFEKSGLLECLDRKHLLQAIETKENCSLSVYGKYFWKLVTNERV